MNPFNEPLAVLAEIPIHATETTPDNAEARALDETEQARQLVIEKAKRAIRAIIERTP